MTSEMLRLLILIAVFASVLLLSERVISSFRSSRSDSGAINKRLRLIARGVSREEVTSILRRPGTQNMMGLPDRFSGPIIRIEQALSGAGLTISPRPASELSGNPDNPDFCWRHRIGLFLGQFVEFGQDLACCDILNCSWYGCAAHDCRPNCHPKAKALDRAIPDCT